MEHQIFVLGQITRVSNISRWFNRYNNIYMNKYKASKDHHDIHIKKVHKSNWTLGSNSK